MPKLDRSRFRFSLRSILIAVGLLCVLLGYYVQLERERYRKATIDGKYSVLLKRLRLPKDVNSYGAVNDWGFWEGTSYAGFSDLPQGYWVYVEPDWYIWEKSDGRPSIDKTWYRDSVTLDALEPL